MTVTDSTRKHEGSRRLAWRWALVAGCLLLPGWAQADYVTGSRGTVPSKDMAFNMNAYAMPPTSCGCTAVAEVRVIGRSGGHEVAVQVGRFPGNANSASWIRVLHRYRSGTDSSGRAIFTTVSVPMGDADASVLENYRWNAVTATIDPVDASMTLRYSKQGVWTTVSTPAIAGWPGTHSMQMHARNTHKVHSRMHLQRATVLTSHVWAYFTSGGSTNPFKFLHGATTTNFTVEYQP